MRARIEIYGGIVLMLVLPILFTAGCSGDGLTGTPSESTKDLARGSTPGASTLGAAKNAAVNVGGTWNWSREEHLTFPDWVAQAVLGIQPEGPTTSARCEGSGIMSLIQGGSEFTGTLEETAHQCVTKGGQVFQDPGASIPVAITDGLVKGRSVKMTLDGVTIDCEYNTVAAYVEGNTAIVLEGGGSCIVPGHPKSDVPLNPPPAGTSKTLRFTAERQ